MRILRRLVITLVVLAALLLALDRVAAYAASTETAHQIEQQGASSVHVRILGFPFLTQVARSKLETVTLSARQVRGSAVTLDSLAVTAHGVHLPLSQAVRGRVSSVPIDDVTGSAVLTYGTLSTTILQALDAGTTFRLTLTPAGSGDVKATVSGPLGVSLSVDVPVPAVSAGRLQLGVFVQRFASVLPGSVAQDLSVPLPSLPYGLRLSSATARSDGIHFAVSGRDVTVQ